VFALFPTRSIALVFLGFPVHWYGLLYLAAFLIAWWMLPRLLSLRQLSLTKDECAGILAATILGVLIGGRLGYVLFYSPLYYLRSPLQIFAVWNGGMASHGGFIGVLVALYLQTRTWKRVDQLKLLDLTTVPAAIGLGLGRIGNFINQELYGTVTSLPWGIDIPGVIGSRHPVQLYDCIGEWIIAGVCFFALKRLKHPGQTIALFLMCYSVLRLMIELFRENAGLMYGPLSEGQWLTIPLLIIGVMFLVKPLWLVPKSVSKK